MNPLELPLRDIHLPPAPGWWPPAPGWWGVLAIIMIMCVGWIWWRQRARRRRSALAQARMELTRLRAEPVTLPASRVAAELSALLRRVCISLYPRQQVASLTGASWLQFLDQAQGDRQFSDGAGRLLIQAPYRPGISRQEIDPLLDLCAAWIAAMERRMPRSPI